ncbi:MAG: 4Fe-4S ferredoxin, partial [Treponema sp.]|nr:4Fe-4S ferredoxin [Treponema sp.]
DKACIDAVNAAPGIPVSIWGEREHSHQDHFTDIHPATDWRSQISHAEKIGLGSAAYELITVK